jgi:hypothetical protein
MGLSLYQNVSYYFVAEGANPHITSIRIFPFEAKPTLKNNSVVVKIDRAERLLPTYRTFSRFRLAK